MGWWVAHRTHKTHHKSRLRSRHQTQVSDPPQGDDVPHLKPPQKHLPHARHSTEDNPGRKLRRHPDQPQPPHRFLWWEHVIKACSFSRSEAREKSAARSRPPQLAVSTPPRQVRPDPNVTQRKGGFKQAPKPLFTETFRSAPPQGDDTPDPTPHAKPRSTAAKQETARRRTSPGGGWSVLSYVFCRT